MTGIDNVNSSGGAIVSSSTASASSASGELAKCESQLSDWVHCPSSKTDAGKAKIAEITSKIDAIKAQIKKAEDAKHLAAVATQAPPVKAAQQLRLDGMGSWVYAQA